MSLRDKYYPIISVNGKQRYEESMIKTIKPLYGSQLDIDRHVENLSSEDKMRYEELLTRYNTAIDEASPDHELIAKLIQEANKILK